MRALIRRAPRDRRPDPAPSRLAYRFTRFWLSPRMRGLVMVLLPLGLALGALAAHIAKPETRERIAAASAQLRASVEARPEFQVRQLKITGASPQLAAAIRERLNLRFPMSWFDLRPAELHAQVAALDAVQEVAVEVHLGGAVTLAVTQRRPAVLWRHAPGLEILDETGHRIAFIDRRDGLPGLPLLTGAGADRAVPEALSLVAQAGTLAPRILALTRQGARRWDVLLNGGQTIRLPAEAPHAALGRVVAMDDAMDLLGRDLAVVDMRLPGRPTVQLGPDALDYLRNTRTFQKDLALQ